MAIKTIILIAVEIILMAVAQIFFKKSGVFFANNKDLSFIYRFAINPYFYVAIFIFAIATIIWVVILSKERLSIVYPILSLAYVVAAILGSFFLNEKITALNFIGVLIIIAGVFLVTYCR